MQVFIVLFCFVLLKFNGSFACSMENINNWLLPVTTNIYDTERDVFFRRSTTNIEGINSVTNSEGLNGGPYLTVSYSNSEFTIAPNAQFENYEENETEHSIGITVNFRCSGGSSNTLVFIINIIDTNNNAPQFRPSDNYHYKVAPPLPPGFLITDCVSNLIVRDIDLTTQRIDLEIEENPFFEIVSDTSTTPKEFKATLRTTTFIRRISEPIVLWIKATDVDLTGDPPITSNATVHIEADTEFEFPDELIFSQTFYIANYTIEGNILLESDIYLQQGYDASVSFSLEGDNKDLFDIDVNENRITLRAVSQLPTDLLTSQIYLILKASREHTSGATATIVVNLPEEPNLRFEDAYYKGSIVDNSLRIQDLVLKENSDYPVQLNIYSEFSQYFTASVQNNNVILRMDPLNDEIIKNNNILTLKVVAIANNRTTATVVVLEIVKDDLTTPIFEKNIYNVTYDPILGVTAENITFIQGFDETVILSLEGDFKNYFQIKQDGNIFNIITTGLPSHVLNEQRLLLTIIATKPRTVGAQAVLYIALPQARALAFKSLTYSGFLVNNSVILETIELYTGYDEDVAFDLSGDYAKYFIQSNEGNLITLSVLDQIPESVISDVNILILILTAEGNNTEIARTTVILEIIKQDTTTPMFNKNIYHGTYLDAATMSIENIFLTQGYDENVIFRLSGDNAQYFSISYNGNNNISVSLDTIIPEELIFNEKVLLFNILAEKPFSVGANAAISVNFPKELTEPVIMRFSKNSYTGNITNEMLTVETIILDEGFQPQTEFLLNGDHASFFNVTNDGNIVTVQLNEKLPEDIFENKKIIILNIEAIRPRTIKAHATIVIEIISQIEPTIIVPVFERAYYYGQYSVEDKLQFNQTIQLREGYHENIIFELEGDSSVWFSLTPLDNGVILTLQSSIPSEVLANNQQFIFIVTANVFNSTISARSTIVIAVTNDIEEIVVLDFNKPNIFGTIVNNTLDMESISLVQGFSPDVVFTLQGELASFFYKVINESTVKIQLKDMIPDSIVPNNRIFILELVATAPKAVPAFVTIVIEVVRHEIPSINDLLKFAQAYYIGAYDLTDGLYFNYNITLAEGNDETVQFTLVGENSLWFGVVPTESGVTISLTSPIPIDVINNNRQLIFEISASKPSSSVTARSVIIITINELNTTQILSFEKNNYLGTVNNITVNLEPIILVEGFTTDVQFLLNGELANFFIKRIDGAMVYILLEETMPEEILSGNRVIVLELEARASEALPSYTTIVLEVIQQNHLPVHVLKFKEPYYTGRYKENDVFEFEQVIALTDGSSNGVEYSLEGDKAIWFSLEEVEDGLLVILSTPIPQNIQSENLFLVFIITATKPKSVTARSTIVISLPNGSHDNNIYFNKLLYRGVISDNVISHENILVSGYNGTDVEIFGDHVNLFIVQINQGVVTVELRDTTAVGVDNTYVILEIRVPGAGCVLQLDVIAQEIPALPTVRFSSESYVIQVDISQTGLIGQVSATADNGESITYSLFFYNEKLKERLSINSNGQLHLKASVSSGVYTCRVVATTDITQVNGTATVILVVESGEEIGLPPLIIIEKDEESPYNNLVTLNTSQDCRYEMTNRWPIDQTWLYVDDNGLHTNAIDREHKSIAFMALSQIQVELTLQCDYDVLAVRSNRLFNNIPMTKSLGPYDYGTYRWVLTDPILYDPRRSFVNLIVNDINDNDPIFELKENEPIAVGYPLPQLEEIVPPRALVELTATDADIGENAALVYWSSEPALAVSPTTGRVHVSNNSLLQHGAILRVSATDRNGVDGRTGHIDLMVRLLDVHQIAVVTVQGAFLEDEKNVITNLTNALGYDVKALRSVILPMDSDTNENTSRRERAAVVSAGAFLRLFIYGLINRKPVEVSRLTSDINSIVMGNIASTVSLEDHLESREICLLPARETGLLAATIALSILLFIIIVVSGVWFFLKWRNTYNYKNFSDQNSLASRDQIPPTVKVEEPEKPRMNIEELKRSERRLQDILDAPKTSTQNDNQTETVVDVPTPDLRMPIVIQSIDKLKDAAETSDDEDEFGETQKARRKSVVTFNENVEKIIHLEDTPSDDADYEVYKF